jgi:hypothetical protein
MRGVQALATLSLAVLASSPAAAQELDRAAPLIEAPKEYSATPIQVGAAAMLLGVDLRGEYLDNIYALPEDRIGDFRLTAFPWTSLTLDKDRYRIAARAQAAVRRYAEHTTENSVAGLLTTNGLWRLSQADTLSFNSAIARAVQDRGAPESQRNPALSPRKSNVLTGDLGYRHVGGRIVLTTRAAAIRNNALGRIDRERDFTQWSLQARAGVRASGTYQFFGEGFVTRRIFDVGTNLSGINRDSRTIAGRGGVEIDPGGLVRGEASIGLFRFNPDDSSLDSRVGVSASASLIYQPRERLAFTLDAFNGDVATVLNGAQQRTDTRVRFGIQQEIFHNLRWQGGVAYLRTKYNGNPATERTFGGIAEVEYLVNRRVAVALQGRHGNRNSTDRLDEFRANSIGLELRLQY